jgi:Tfp pilus assembly protein FimT
MERLMGGRAGKGFTLFEAVVSVALLASLVYLGSTGFLKMAPRYSLDKAVWEIRSALNAVRYRALFEGASYRVRFSGSAYAIERYEESAKAWVFAGRTPLEKVVIGSNNAPVFTPEGTVTGLATIAVSNEWGEYKLTLAITGRIKTARVR